jgi:hypothetical protein
MDAPNGVGWASVGIIGLYPSGGYAFDSGAIFTSAEQLLLQPGG